MKNTLENKAKFFALHWRQPIMFDQLDEKGNPIKYSVLSSNMHLIEKAYLELKPLYEITKKDLEAIGFSFNHGFEGIKIEFDCNSYEGHWRAFRYGYYQNEGYLALRDFDYLRSKGYALPWMDFTIHDLLKYDWITFKQ